MCRKWMSSQDLLTMRKKKLSFKNKYFRLTDTLLSNFLTAPDKIPGNYIDVMGDDMAQVVKL